MFVTGKDAIGKNVHFAHMEYVLIVMGEKAYVQSAKVQEKSKIALCFDHVIFNDVGKMLFL